MGLNQNSLREGQTSGAFWGLLHAYDLKSEFRKCLAHMRGEVLFPVGKPKLSSGLKHT